MLKHLKIGKLYKVKKSITGSSKISRWHSVCPNDIIMFVKIIESGTLQLVTVLHGYVTVEFGYIQVLYTN